MKVEDNVFVVKLFISYMWQEMFWYTDYSVESGSLYIAYQNEFAKSSYFQASVQESLVDFFIAWLNFFASVI
jgi:hypothetical protein